MAITTIIIKKVKITLSSVYVWFITSNITSK